MGKSQKCISHFFPPRLTLSLAILIQYNLAAFPIFNSYKCHWIHCNFSIIGCQCKWSCVEKWDLLDEKVSWRQKAAAFYCLEVTRHYSVTLLPSHEWGGVPLGFVTVPSLFALQHLLLSFGPRIIRGRGHILGDIVRSFPAKRSNKRVKEKSYQIAIHFLTTMEQIAPSVLDRIFCSWRWGVCRWGGWWSPALLPGQNLR